MATQIGIGFSQSIDAQTAARDAAFESKTNLNADRIDFALIFATVHYDPKETMPVFQAVLNQTQMIGCSTAGIILSDSIETRGVAVLTLSSDEIKLGSGCIEDLDSQDIQQAGSQFARETLSNFGPSSRQLFMFLMDGHLRNNSAFLKGIQNILGNVFPILGAGSSDDFHFANTYQLYNDRILTNAAAGLIIGGHANVSLGSHHGWRPLGKPRIINKVEGNTIQIIDGKKAFNLYEDYFSDKAKDLHSDRFGQMSILYPLGVFVEGSNEYLLRNIVSVQPDGSIVCQGDVPEGSEVHIMISNKEACKQAAIDAAQDVHKGLLGKTPKMILIFESMARLKLLGRMAYEEIENIRNIFGANVPIIGMYSNGEVCPFQTVEKFKKPYLLNESIVVLAIS